MDIVYIRDLRIDTVIGIYDWERQIKQTVRLDIELATDTARAAASNAIDDTLDYSAIAERVTSFIQDSEFLLLEVMAERIAGLILSEFNAPWLRLSVGKPGAVGNAREVGVIIERGNK